MQKHLISIVTTILLSSSIGCVSRSITYLGPGGTTQPALRKGQELQWKLLQSDGTANVERFEIVFTDVDPCGQHHPDIAAASGGTAHCKVKVNRAKGQPDIYPYTITYRPKKSKTVEILPFRLLGCRVITAGASSTISKATLPQQTRP